MAKLPQEGITRQAINIKHGTYLPLKKHLDTTHGNTESEPGNKPPDPFKLQTIITQDESARCMALKIETGYIPLYLMKVHLMNVLRPLKTLSNNKSPGPDGIVNELLRMLPTEIQETIHMLFIIMWASGFTPRAWKTSNTILIEQRR